MPKKSNGYLPVKKTVSSGDTRPYEAYDPENPDKYLVRCWYLETVKEYCKQTGSSWRKREVAVPKTGR